MSGDISPMISAKSNVLHDTALARSFWMPHNLAHQVFCRGRDPIKPINRQKAKTLSCVRMRRLRTNMKKVSHTTSNFIFLPHNFFQQQQTSTLPLKIPENIFAPEPAPLPTSCLGCLCKPYKAMCLGHEQCRQFHSFKWALGERPSRPGEFCWFHPDYKRYEFYGLLT